MNRFGEIIKQCRESANLKQADIAEDLGVVQATVSQWEKGGSVPNHKMLERIADYFCVDINLLLGYPSEGELVFKQGLELLRLDKYKQLSRDDKEFVADQFNALIEKLTKQ